MQYIWKEGNPIKKNAMMSAAHLVLFTMQHFFLLSNTEHKFLNSEFYDNDKNKHPFIKNYLLRTYHIQSIILSIIEDGSTFYYIPIYTTNCTELW